LAKDVLAELDAAVERVFPGGNAYKDDEQRRKLGLVLADLQQKTTRIELLRLAQAAELDTSESDVVRRASVKLVSAAMKEHVPTLAQSADRAGWARVIGHAILSTRTSDAATRLGVHPTAVFGRQQLPITPPPALAAVPNMKFEDYEHTSVYKSHLSAIMIPDYLLDQSNRQININQIKASILNGIIPILNRHENSFHSIHAYAAVAISVLTKACQQHQSTISNIVSEINSRNQDDELNALWWSQSLYSQSAQQEYRDLADTSPHQLLPAMATDLIAVLGHDPDPSVLALFVETARRLRADLDERRPYATWVHDLVGPDAFTADFLQIVRDDDTAIPVAGLLAAANADALTARLQQEVPGRHVVRQYLRERMLAAWLAEG
jgi:hypothetical protein